MSDTDIKKSKPKLLLHVCCIGCGAYVSRLLNEDFEVSLYFFNPSIYPESEYKKRLAEAGRIANLFGLELINGEYDHGQWLKKIKGHESDPERGERCRICYRDRLENTARLAVKNGFAYFTTTLTVSPHKDALAISQIGKETEKNYRIKFFDKDFKKQDGFKKSTLLSCELGLYRQNYCGCEFSRRN